MKPGPCRLGYLGRVLPTLSETFVVREIAALRRLGVQVKCFSLHPPEAGVFHPEAPHLAREVEVLVQPRNPWFWLAHLWCALWFPRRYVRALYAYVLAADEPWSARRRCLAYFVVAPFAAWRLRRAGIQHLHAHFANAPASLALMAAALAGISFSFTAHAYDIFIDRLLLPAKLAAAAFVACISRYNVRYLREHYPEARQAHLEVVRNGLDLTRFSPRPHPRGDPPCIIAVGRLVETKGFHVLVAACARLRAEGLDCHGLIIGEGPEAARLQQRVNALGLADRIVLKGRLDPADMLAYYRQADVLAMPSCVRNRDADGIPTVLIEALAMEIPVVATRVSGIPELVVDGETGLLVAPDDPAALAQALARLLQDQELARQLARAGRDLVVSHYNGAASARQLCGLFESRAPGPAINQIMCGICGMWHFNGAPVDPNLLRRMTRVLQHRGPDDEGFYEENGLGLGFRRLSIIDLAGGRQPMSNEDQTVTVVFNGEIYNFQELRAELRHQGHTFSTASDTEVIVHGYEAWGDDVVHRLNGMFAFAAWDSRRQKLLLARDRLGIKPLFYTQTPDTLAFASEIKSLLLLPGFDPAVSDLGVFDYFSHHFIPGSGTIYQNIQKLKPGEVLSATRSQVQTRTYWRPQITASPHRTLADWCQDLRQRLSQAVRLQLVADVPLGVFLSGGLDSSAVTAAMAGLGREEIRTFNVGFDVPSYDETRFARQVSRHLGTRHETFRVLAEATDLLPKLLWHLDEPLADATVIPTYLLSQATRRHVTVALSGEGGDELFGGYTHYQGMQLNRWLSLLPLWCRRTLAAAARHLPSGGSPRLGYLAHRLERIAATSLLPLFQGYTRKVAFFTPEDQQRLFSPEFQRRTAGLPYLQHFWDIPQAYPGLDPIAQANLADLSVFLPDSLLVKVDRMSMACSLEVRVPLLDHTLVEFALSVPMDHKVKGLRTKHLFREALAPWLPPAIVNRPKRGFNPPVEFWLQQHLTGYAREHRLMETLAATGYFNLATVQAMADAHIGGRRDFGKQLWALLVFAIWWARVRGRGEAPS